MLKPKNTKFKKMQKGRNTGIKANMKISFGLYAMVAITRGSLTSSQIESARKVISKSMKRQGKLWIRVFPDKPITKKPLEVRMGKGKGNVENWISVVRPGNIIYEIDYVSEEIARKCFKLASDKLPIKTNFIIKNNYI